MLKQVESYIQNNKLFSKKHKLLLAISGGVDSIACLHLLNELGYDLALAHCNFSLRAEESDLDEAFVKQNAQRYNLKVHVKIFDTEKFANETGISIQMAARDLRYNWFNELLEEYDYDYLIIAHHLDDAIETSLINLCRGTGIKGIAGIKNAIGSIRRPLLSVTRQQIEEYVLKNKLVFREDSSNLKIDYSRNRIRHKVIPELKLINPGLENSFKQSLDNFTQEMDVLEIVFEQEKATILQKSDEGFAVKIKRIVNSPYRNWILYRLLAEYGFSLKQVESINESLGVRVGTQFQSGTFNLLVDREYMFISILKPTESKEYEIGSDCLNLSEPFSAEIEFIDNKNFTLDADPYTAYLDADSLSFPLKLTSWKIGDSFRPLGMDKSQKISDFFINNKIPRDQKNKIWILRSEGEIVWIVGHRIDHRFRVKSGSIHICRIRVKI